MERLLTIDETCELLGLKRSYIYSLTHRGEIPYVKIGNHLRFRVSDLETWVADQVRGNRLYDESRMERRSPYARPKARR